MKKFFLIMVISIITINLANSQTVYSPDKGKYEYIYKGNSTDTVGAGNTSWSMIVTPKKDEALYYNHQLSLSKTGGTLALSIKFQGKYFYTDPLYTDIATANFIGTQTDTLINCAQFTTKSGYNYFKVLVTRTNGTAKINKYKVFFRK